MRPIRAIAAAAVMALLWSGPLYGAERSADDSAEKQRRATDMAIEATQMLMRALDLMIEALPEYGPPYINDKGDIVIPRIHKGAPPEPAGKSAPAKPGPETPL